MLPTNDTAMKMKACTGIWWNDEIFSAGVGALDRSMEEATADA
jgi:hypothetical protein